MIERVRRFALTAILLACPVLASADGITDPVPLLNGTMKAKLLYTVLGVHQIDDTLSTSWHCTSTEKPGGPTIHFAVEVFEQENLQNDVTSGGVVSLNPGQTKIISTENTSLFGESIILVLSSGEVSRASSRILSTSKRLVCVAFLISPDTTTGVLTPLPVLKGIKQGGQ